MLKKISILFTVLVGLIVIGFYSTKALVIEKVNNLTERDFLITTQIEDYGLGVFPPRVEVTGLELKDAKGMILNLKKIVLQRNQLNLIGGELFKLPVLPKTKSSEKKSGEAGLPLSKVMLKDFSIGSGVILEKDEILINKLEISNLKLEGEELSLKLKEANLSIDRSKISIKGSLSKGARLALNLDFKLKQINLEKLTAENKFKKIEGLKGELDTSGELKVLGEEIELSFDSKVLALSYKTKEAAEYSIESALLIGSFKGNKNFFEVHLNKSSLKGIKQVTKEGPAQSIRDLVVNKLEYKKKEKAGHYFKASLNRDATIVMDSDQGYLNLDIDNLDLKNYSEFLIIDSNNNIDSGKLFSTYRSKIDSEENIDGKLSVSLSQLNFIEREGGTSIGSFMSITKAVGIIKDENGKVKLDSKIEGKVSDPEFDLISYLSKGIGSIIADKFYSLIALEAAKRVAPLLLNSIPINPLNALTLLKAGYKFAVKPRFNDIKFTPHSFQILGRELKTLERVVAFLKAQKEVSLSFCPETFLKEEKSVLELDTALEINKKRMDSVLSIVKGIAPGVEKQIVFCGLPKSLKEEGRGSLNIQI